MKMESKPWSEFWKLAPTALLSWSAVILRLPELFISLKIRPHNNAEWIFPLHSKQWCPYSSSFALSGAFHRYLAAAHFACNLESLLKVSVAADVDVDVVVATDVDVVVVGAAGGC